MHAFKSMQQKPIKDLGSKVVLTSRRLEEVRVSSASSLPSAEPLPGSPVALWSRAVGRRIDESRLPDYPLVAFNTRLGGMVWVHHFFSPQPGCTVELLEQTPSTIGQQL